MFGVDTTAIGVWVPAPKWTDKDIPDLTGKVIVVTGANAGIGQESARVLVSKGARVYAACRSQEKAEKAIAEIKASTGKTDIHFLKLDLSDLPSCVRAGKELSEKESRLDVALLSAGVMFTPRGSKSAQGLELQFATNVLGHYAFVKQLEPLLIKTAKEAPPASVRVVWVSSSAHHAFPPRDGIPYDKLDAVTACSPYTYYGISKLGNVQMANAMAERLRPHGILSVSLNPGNIRTELTRHLSVVERFIARATLYPVELGALTQLYAATATELTLDDTASYFVPWARKYRALHRKANDATSIQQTADYVEKTIAAHL